MTHMTLRAHFDGTHILLDDPVELQPNTKLLITIIETDNAEQADWRSLSAHGLAAAYSDDEPDYPMRLIKEHNPDYA